MRCFNRARLRHNKRPPESSLRQSPSLSLQRAIGNQALGRMLQTKLTISEPGDIYEQEADRVAEHVMRMPTVVPESSEKPLNQAGKPPVQHNHARESGLTCVPRHNPKRTRSSAYSGVR